MNARIKNLIIGSPVEGIARRVHSLLKTETISDVYDKQTVAVMKRSLSRGSNCVDVGCHSGQILKEILRFAPAGTHYAFEPIQELYRGLVERYPGVNVFDLGLSDTVGKTSFQYVTDAPAYSGFRRREYDRPRVSIEEIEVKTDLLDNIIAEDFPVHFIKIDVEGAELQVLRGAIDTIRRNKPIIVFEHGLGGADFYGTTPEEVYDLLSAQCGLCLSLMESWLRNEEPLSREEFADQFYQHINYYFIAHP